MKNFTISGAAYLYYKENVEGEPLDQNTPIECFEAGAEFVINSQKKRNNCNIPEGISYKAYTRKIKRKKDAMYEKIAENVSKIITVTGFYITAPGDDSVGIPSSSWEMKNDFHFDTPEDLEIFRKEIKELYEFHCGEVVSVISFEEYNAELEAELVEEYKQYPVRYLITGDYSAMYMRPDPFHGMYSSDVAECIHHVLPHYMTEKSEGVIPSTSDEYWTIIRKALAEKQQSLNVNSQHYHGAKNSVQLLLKELNYGA